MASEVEVCNLALSHLGDRATVASIDPPEGSAQAEHCARYYPIARDSLLEMARPGFATRRAALAALVDVPDAWQFAYTRPADALAIVAVVAPEQTDDFGDPSPFVCELDANGDGVIYTNVEQAQVRYIARVEDTSRFSPLFVIALSWHLASMLAGPILKGDAGAAEGKRCEQMMMGFLARFSASDASQRSVRPVSSPAWIRGR